MKKRNGGIRFGAALLTCLMLMGGFAASAASPWSAITGTNQWLALPGNEQNGAIKKPNIALGANGLTITYTGGEYSPGGSNAGVMYATPVDIKDFSVEFTVTKTAGAYNYSNPGVDSWISLCLLNKSDKYFNVNKAGESQGIVTLIRPLSGKTLFEINQLTNSWGQAARRGYEHPGSMQATFTVAIKKNAEGTYNFLINGQKVDLAADAGSEFTTAFTTLMERGDVYFYMGVSCKTYTEQIEWRINKINGQAVKADGGGAATTAAPAASTAANTTASTAATRPAGSAGSTGSATTGTDSQTGQTNQTDTVTTAETPNTDEPGSTGTAAASAESGITTTVATTGTTGKTNTAGQNNVSPGLVAGIVAGVLVVAGGGTAAVIILRRKKNGKA